MQDIATQAGGWRERLAIAVLTALQNALKGGTPFREAMSGAYQKASDAAAGIADFAREHPLYAAAICTVIALGILMILAPYVIHALGFGVLGPVEGRNPLEGLILHSFGFHVPLLIIESANETSRRFLGRGLAVGLWRSGGVREFVFLFAKIGHALQVNMRLKVYSEQRFSFPSVCKNWMLRGQTLNTNSA